MHQHFAFLTGRVRLLLVHGQKLVPLVLGSDPLFPQEPACGTWYVYLLHACFNHWDAQISLGSSARWLHAFALRSLRRFAVFFALTRLRKRQKDGKRGEGHVCPLRAARN